MDRLLPLLIAPFVGSFLGVLIRRLPHGQPVLWDRSRCESCGAALGIPDLVPLASYAALRGRCRSCGGAIDPAHWHVEALALLVAGSAVLADPAGPLLWVDCALGWTLLTLAWIDAEHMLLPDVLTLPLLVAGLGATLWLEPEAAWEHAAAATLGFTGLWAVGALYRAARGRDGVGGGDPKLLAALGAWVGLDGLPLVLLGAALAGLAWAAAMALRGKQVGRYTPIPFGTCLALAGWVVRLQS